MIIQNSNGALSVGGIGNDTVGALLSESDGSIIAGGTLVTQSGLETCQGLQLIGHFRLEIPT